MTDYKLTYFNSRGKAEIIRLIFALADVKYEDKRYEYSAWPGEIKKTLDLPFGQLPTLAIDGVLYSQVLPITRYLAEKYGLAGKTDLDRLRADMIIHCTEDVLFKLIRARMEENSEIKEKLVKKFSDEELPQYCGHFDKMLKQNKGGQGFLVGDSITWADLHLFQLLTAYVPMINVKPDYINAYPDLKAFTERVSKNPKIAAWIARRPETEF